MKIYKYILNVPIEDNKIEMPIGAEILHVASQDGYPTIWAVTHPDRGMEIRVFKVIGTGEEFKSGRLNYHGTAHCGSFVWHVFEKVT